MFLHVLSAFHDKKNSLEGFVFVISEEECADMIYQSTSISNSLKDRMRLVPNRVSCTNMLMIRSGITYISETFNPHGLQISNIP